MSAGRPGQPGGQDAPRRRPLLVTAIPVVALAVLLGWVAWNGLKTDSGSSRGPRPGSQMPPFAAPLALSAVNGDVNVARRAGEGAAGSRPACEVRGEGILNSCDLVARRPVVLAFVGAGQQRCAEGLDRLVAASRGTGVGVAGVIVRGSQQEARSLASARGWKVPVAWDRDGVLANLYGVAVCPQYVYLRRGGTVSAVGVGEASTSSLAARLRALAGEGR